MPQEKSLYNDKDVSYALKKTSYFKIRVHAVCKTNLFISIHEFLYFKRSQCEDESRINTYCSQNCHAVQSQQVPHIVIKNGHFQLQQKAQPMSYME